MTKSKIPLTAGKLFVFVILVLASVSAFAQETLWTRTYGGSGDDIAASVQLTSDGGYIIVGYTRSFCASGSCIWLIKTNTCGDTIWTRTYDWPYSSEEWLESAECLQQTADGGYIITGISHAVWSPYADLVLMKTDSLGNMEWIRTYGGGNFDYGNSVKQTPDAGYIVRGNTLSFGAGGLDIWVLKTDSEGDTICDNCWARTYGGGGWDGGTGLLRTSDGGYLITGDTWSYGAGGNDAYLIKIDSTGHALWTRTYEAYGYDCANIAQKTFDGGYIMAGWTSISSYSPGVTDVYVIRTDSLGYDTCSNCWTRTYGGDSGVEHGVSAFQTADGGYILTGSTTSFGAGGSDIWLIKTDSAGNILWDTTYGGSADDRAAAAQLTPDEGYIIILGTTSSLGAGGWDVWLIKASIGGPVYILGDANGDGVINVVDVVYLINYLFISGPAPNPVESGDVNCDHTINAADVVYLINYLFIKGPPPCR